MKNFYLTILKFYLRCHAYWHERIFFFLSKRCFDGLHPKNVFNFRAEFFQDNCQADDVVVDIACGTGTILQRIANKIKKGVGIEYDPANIAICRRKNSAANIEYIELDVLKVNYSDLHKKYSYNKAIFSHILEHIEDVPALLRRVNAQSILVCVPSQENWYRQLLRHLNLYYYSDPTHFREYTREMLSSELREAGYSIEFIGFNAEGEIICSAQLSNF